VTGSEEDRELLKEAKEMLFNAYNQIKEDEIKGKWTRSRTYTVKVNMPRPGTS